MRGTQEDETALFGEYIATANAISSAASITTIAATAAIHDSSLSLIRARCLSSAVERRRRDEKRRRCCAALAAASHPWLMIA